MNKIGISLIAFGILLLLNTYYPILRFIYLFPLIILSIGVYKVLKKSENKLSDYFTGGVFIIIGVIFFLKSANVINFEFFNLFRIYWPILLIIIGVSIILKIRWFGWLLLLLILLFLSSSVNMFENNSPARVITKEFSTDSLSKFNLELNHGADSLLIKENDNNLVKIVANTNDINDPVMNYNTLNNKASLQINRNFENLIFQKNTNSWEISLDPNIETDISLNSGASDTTINLENLKINNLEINSGASKIKVIYGKYPTKTSINTGASKIEAEFPNDYNVKITVEGAINTINLPGFKKNGKVYYNENYDDNKDGIELNINAGVTNLEGKTY